MPIALLYCNNDTITILTELLHHHGTWTLQIAQNLAGMMVYVHYQVPMVQNPQK